MRAHLKIRFPLCSRSGRSDTISSIVSSLLGEDDQFRALREELEHGDPATFTVQVSPDGEEIEDYTDPDWEPEPVDAGPSEYLRLGLIGPGSSRGIALTAGCASSHKSHRQITAQQEGTISSACLYQSLTIKKAS